MSDELNEVGNVERNAFYRAHGLDPTPSWGGEKTDKGRLVPRSVHPGEGYAVLRCGNTEVVLSYTLLHHLSFVLESESSLWGAVADANKALRSITAEASIGRNGDEKP